MKKITIFLFLVFSLIGFLVGFYLLRLYECGNSVSCYNLITKAEALYYSMPALALIFFILLFTPHARVAWGKFARWFIPIAALLFISYNGPSSGDFLAPYPEELFKWVSILYVIVSLIIIAWSSVKKAK